MKKSVFDLHKNLKEYFETSDGFKFIKEADAKTHARSLKDKEVKNVKRPLNKDTSAGDGNTDNKGSGELTPMQKAKLRAEKITKMDDVAAIKEALKNDTAKTVKDAGEARIKELEAGANENGSEGGQGDGGDSKEAQ